MTALREEVARALLLRLMSDDGVPASELDRWMAEPEAERVRALADAVIPIILGRAAEVAEDCAIRADRVEMINAFGVEAAQHAVVLAEGIAAAIRQIGRGE